MSTKIANTPPPPYYAVIFCSVRTQQQDDEYASMDKQMTALAAQQDGFLDIESARQGIGITISYWRNLEAIKAWKEQAAHIVAQKKGKAYWYTHYKVRIAKVERDYYFEKRPNR